MHLMSLKLICLENPLNNVILMDWIMVQHHIRSFLTMLHPRVCRWRGGRLGIDEKTTNSSGGSDCYGYMWNSFVPVDKSSIQECSLFSCLTRPFRPQLPRLCHAASHAC